MTRPEVYEGKFEPFPQIFARLLKRRREVDLISRPSKCATAGQCLGGADRPGQLR